MQTIIPNNGKAIERGILILGFMLQIGAMVYSYGRMSAAVDALDRRLTRIESYIDHKLESGR